MVLSLWSHSVESTNHYLISRRSLQIGEAIKGKYLLDRTEAAEQNLKYGSKKPFLVGRGCVILRRFRKLK